MAILAMIDRRRARGRDAYIGWTIEQTILAEHLTELESADALFDHIWRWLTQLFQHCSLGVIRRNRTRELMRQWSQTMLFNVPPQSRSGIPAKP